MNLRERFRHYADTFLAGVPVDDLRYIAAETAFYAGALNVACALRDGQMTQDGVISESEQFIKGESRPAHRPVIQLPEPELKEVIDSIDGIINAAVEKGAGADALCATLVGHATIKMFQRRRKQLTAGAARQVVSAFMQDVRGRASKASSVN